MLLYRCTDTALCFWEDGDRWDIPLPRSLAGNRCALLLSPDGRYIAFGNDRSIPAGSPPGTTPPAGAHGLWLYDRETMSLRQVPHAVKPKDVFCDMAFGPDGALYYSDGNTFWRFAPEAEQPEKLLRFQSVKGAPMGLSVSPGGRYLSYYKYRSDAMRLHLFDREQQTDRDMGFSIFHYGWLDDGHIVWTKSGGLKLLDVASGKNTTLLRDHKALCKRCPPRERELLAPFLPWETVFEELALLSLREGRIWLRLWLHPYQGPGLPPQPHHGAWSVSPTGDDPRFHYDIPPDYRSSLCAPFMRQGRFCWMASDGTFHAAPGEACPPHWLPVLLSDDLPR